MKRAALALTALALAACSTETVVKTKVVKGTAIDHGEALFADHNASPSTLNAFSCATCHAAEAGEASGRILPGAPLAGATSRPTFWGGQENDLLRSINDCLFYFMGAKDRWTADNEDARAMYAYLSSLPDGAAGPASFTVVAAVADLTPGDANAGADTFSRACKSCHGALHTGEGRLTTRAPRLPDDTNAEHKEYSAVEQRVVFVEKIRHGGFKGYGGSMPPFSEETLTDEQVAGLLSYFDLYK
jgi:thiosulfate dehydrogenase